MRGGWLGAGCALLGGCQSAPETGALPAAMAQYGVVTISDVSAVVDATLRVEAGFYEVSEPGWAPVDPFPAEGCARLSAAPTPVAPIGAGALSLHVGGEVHASLADPEGEHTDDAAPSYLGAWEGEPPWGEEVGLSVGGAQFPAVALQAAVQMPASPVVVSVPEDGAEVPVPFTVRWSVARDGTPARVLIAAVGVGGTVACQPRTPTSLWVDEQVLALLGEGVAGVEIRVERQRTGLHTVAPGVGLAVRGRTADAVSVRLVR